MPTTTDSSGYILIKGARVHNLKNMDVSIPRNRLVVITGLSGSGKSSLAFDTLFAEGQRRYVESLSSYARQFIGRMNKPEVDYITGISPAVAIEQKVNTRNPRSTVGTSTEIYDYLKLLFARIGKTISPVSGREVRRHAVTDVLNAISVFPEGTKLFICAPLYLHHGRDLHTELGLLLQKGFSRIKHHGKLISIVDFLEENTGEKLASPEKKVTGKKKKINTPDAPSHSSQKQNDTLILIDRIVFAHGEEDVQARIADSVQTAFYEGDGECMIEIQKEDGSVLHELFSNRFELDGITFEEPSANLFSFNNPYGACRCCEGFGQITGIDEDLVVPNKNLSVYEGAVACWRGEKMKEWNEALIKHAYKFDFPIHRPFYQLGIEDQKLLWDGNKYFQGIHAFFRYLEEQSYKIQYRVMISRYRGRTACPECNGTRLRKDAGYVKVGEKSIIEIVLMPVKDALVFFQHLKLEAHEQIIAKRLLTEITSRLSFLEEVGLGYLTLNRLSNTLSGGESQRINLATSLGSSLVGSMYILDEPSIGLHPRDTERLIGVLKSLRNLGNTVIVVEHEEAIMRAADHLIDVGPGAGSLGGTLVADGNYDNLLTQKSKSLTARYLAGDEYIRVPAVRRSWKKQILLEGVRENNLKNITVSVPLGVLTVVSGVSGSGKSSLIKKVLFPSLKKIYGGHAEQTGACDKISGDIDALKDVEFVDQNPIGKSTRSNPVTYVKAYDEIRTLYAELPFARSRRLKPSHFSFNVEGGRCEICEGEGEVTIGMQFMADIHLPCEACGGKRFRNEVLEVVYRGKNIADILEMTVDDAMIFFNGDKEVYDTHSHMSLVQSIARKVVHKLAPLAEVGLGYVRLGQSSATLSGGEAQRVKLASFLSKGSSGQNMLFIFDEPTTGLHFHDIKKLLHSFSALIGQGHSVLVIEHNPDVIKCADWVIDLGPEGGEQGGFLVCAGTPEEITTCSESFTAKFLAEKLKVVEAK